MPLAVVASVEGSPSMSTIADVKEAWNNLRGAQDWSNRFRLLGLAVEALTEPEPTITPEQQAVLDAAVAWRKQQPPATTENWRSFLAAVDAYTATLRKPSVADRLEAWAANPAAYGNYTNDRHAFETLIAEVRALEAGK